MNTPKEISEHICSGITGVVLTKNKKCLIEECLSSLSFCSHLLVVGSGNNDNTLSLAKKFTAETVYRVWNGFVTLFLFVQTLVKTLWFCIVDQDELCPKGRGEAISQTITESGTAYHNAFTQNTSVENIPVAFSVEKTSWNFNRCMHHSDWYPNYLFRVFTKDFIAFYHDAHIQYRVLDISAHSGKVGAELIYSLYTNFFYRLQKLKNYVKQGIQVLFASGKQEEIWKGIGHRAMPFRLSEMWVFDGNVRFLCAYHNSIYAFLQ